ncbi:MAG TPA: DUF3501 family protein [Candidatus Kapabacteria bacterium]|nr:DUF3501 family protein [Candidatus Kapabacteria bacterium]
MKPIQFDEVKNIYEYEKVRKPFREKVIAEKKARRIHLGENMTIVFENRDTVLFQIQEMIRTEKIITDRGMQHEIDTYNELLPGENELSATLLIDITDKHLIKTTLDSLIGLNKNSLFLKIAHNEYPANFDESQIEEGRISAVQYIKWKLSAADAQAFADPSTAVELFVRHPNYTGLHTLSKSERSALNRDLSETAENIHT